MYHFFFLYGVLTLCLDLPYTIIIEKVAHIFQDTVLFCFFNCSVCDLIGDGVCVYYVFSTIELLYWIEF